MIRSTLMKSLLSVAVVLVFLPSAFATRTRDDGMGLAKYPWMMDGLQSYMFQNPAYLNDYKNSIYFEKYDYFMGGLIWSPVSNLNISVVTGNPVDGSVWNTTDRMGLFHKGAYSPKLDSTAAVLNNPDENPADNPIIIDLTDPVDGNATDKGAYKNKSYRKSLDSEDISLMASYVLGEMILGLSFGYTSTWSDDIFDNKNTDSEEETMFLNRQFNFRLGWSYVIDNEIKVDADAFGTIYRVRNTYRGVDDDSYRRITYSTNRAFDAGLNAGLHWTLSQEHKVHTALGYAMLNRSTIAKGEAADFRGTDNFDRKGHRILFGVSDEMTYTKSMTVFVGVHMKLTLFDYKYYGEDEINAHKLAKVDHSIMDWEVPVIAGFEARISENWTGRMAVTHYVYNPSYIEGSTTTDGISTDLAQSTTTTVTEDLDPDPSTSVSIGLSYKLGNIRFDWLGNIDLFIDGPSFVSGKTSSLDTPTPMAMAFAVTYDFNSFVDIADTGSESQKDKMKLKL